MGTWEADGLPYSHRGSLPAHVGFYHGYIRGKTTTPQVVLVNGASIATLKWIFSAGYAQSEIYSAMVTARIFSHGAGMALKNCICDFVIPASTMWRPPR